MAVIPTQQYPLRLPLKPSLDRASLVVTQANAQAVALVDQWPNWQSPFAVLAGPTGSGKTHIAQIWLEKSGAVAVSASELADHGWPQARAILLEDIGPGLFDEKTLFFLLNDVRSHGATILMTSQSWPLAWGVQTPDLLSRLKAATTVEIAEPDDELLKGVMLKLFADRQINVEGGVIDFLSARIERSVRTAITLVDALDMASLAKKSPVTKPLAKAVLESVEQRQSGFDFG